jgi:hypothetical protein
MASIRFRPRLWTLLSLTAAAHALAGCVADGPPGAGAAQSQHAQPRLVTYRCDGGSTLTVESRGGAVSVSDGVDASIDLPAAPPAQTSRFGQASYALVIEGREALWMKSGQEPLTCLR